MSLFDVIFNRHEKFSSDANVNSSHDGNTLVAGPLHQADIARVEADSPEAAKAAVAVAYAASTSDVHVHEVKTEPPAETEQTPAAEANASDRSVLANQPYIVPNEYSDEARKPSESDSPAEPGVTESAVTEPSEPVNEVDNEPVSESEQDKSVAVEATEPSAPEPAASEPAATEPTTEQE